MRRGAAGPGNRRTGPGRVQPRFSGAVAAPDDALKAEYERIKATVSGTEYKARHILIAK